MQEESETIMLNFIMVLSDNLDLSQYAIGYQASLDENTLLDWSFPTDATYLKLSGTLESTKCYVIASPQADATYVPSNIVWGTEKYICIRCKQSFAVEWQ